jgi:PIN domain nuclease of toxin-antitoxin system
MSDCVLDGSAILVLLNREPGSSKVETLLPGAFASSVNLAEVAGKLSESGMPALEIRSAIGALGLTIVDFDASMAYETGGLRSLTQNAGLSLGDRACLATGKVLGKPVVTANRAWRNLDVGIRINCVR